MKKGVNLLLIFAVALAVIIVGIVAAVIITGNGSDDRDLTEVRIGYMGSMTPNGVTYSLKRQNGEWVAIRTKTTWLSDATRSKTVDDSFADGILRVLKENKAHKMGNSNIFDLEYMIRKIKKWISTDGVTYSFYMEFSDGSVVQLEEYDNYPGSYRSVLDEFESRYEALFAD